MGRKNRVTILDRNIDWGVLILRLSIGGMMILHGISKMQHGIGPIRDMIVDAGLPAYFSYGVYVGEVIAPLLILVGIATRASAAVLAFNCLVAALMVHSGDLLQLNSQGGWAVELLGLYLFGAVTLVFTGGGKYALSRKFIWD